MTFIVDSQSGAELVGKDSSFILVLDKDENICEAILKCAKDAKINAASLSGLGALENPTIAFYNLEKKQYEEKSYTGIYELISLNGNLSYTDEGELVTHIHVALADGHHRVIGGHFIDATVGVTAEITIVPLPGRVIRKFNPNIGLKLMCSYTSRNLKNL